MTSINKLAIIAVCIAITLGTLAGCQPPVENQTPPLPPPPSDNSAPVIINLNADPTQVEPLGKALITCEAKDPDGDNITYTWKSSQGSLEGSGDIVTWTAPGKSGSYTVTVTTADGKDGKSTKTVTVTVPDKPNTAPAIAGLKYTRPGHSPITIKPDMTDREKERTPDPTIRQYETADISCLATDPDNDELNYTWYTTCGTIKGKGGTVQWIAPSAAFAQNGICTVTCTVSDGRGGSATFQIAIIVKCCGA